MSPAKSDAALLQDMLNHGKEVSEFIAGVSYERFLHDRKLCRATERCLEIVGEAANRISPAVRDALPEIPWRQLRGLRNVLAHDYGEIVEEVIYQCATAEVPHLIRVLERILSAQPDGVGELPDIRIATAPVRMSLAAIRVLEARKEVARLVATYRGAYV